MTIRIATWNVNSIRVRLPQVIAWLSQNQPDVLLLQELKCETEFFPWMEFKALGYDGVIRGQKTYNGVAFLAKTPIHSSVDYLPGADDDTQARYIEATVGDLRIICLYAPNGNPIDSDKYTYKLAWLERLRHHAQRLLKEEKPFILGGDFNVIPMPQDVYNPAGWTSDALFALPSRKAFRAIENMGLTDAFRALHPTAQAYTFWGYRGACWEQDHGLRIDHFLLSPQAADRLVKCVIHKEIRGQPEASDHVPVSIELRSEGPKKI